MTYPMEFVSRLLSLCDKYEAHDTIWWRTGAKYGGGEYAKPATFLAKCSDVFYWGTADCEDITPENIDVLEQSFADLEATGVIAAATCYGMDLFAARVRKMRPQGACYPEAQELWPLFDACGPQRDVGMGNPRKHPRDKLPPLPPIIDPPGGEAGH